MWWIPLIQAGIGITQSILSGNQAAEERAEAERLQRKQLAENEAWYNKEYFTDYTQRADSQNLLKQLREQVRENNNIAERTAAITGATPESVQAQKNAGNKLMADVTGNIAAMGARHKDTIQQNYLNRKSAIQGQQYNSMINNAQSHENGMYNGISQIGSGIMGAFNNYMGGKQAAQQQTNYDNYLKALQGT